MGFWYQRTKLEKKLIVSIVIFFLLAVGLLAGLIVVKNKNKEGSDADSLTENVCVSKECLIAAAEIESSLDRSADPCVDFYQYACGGWMKKNIIAPDRSRWSQFDVTRKKLLDDLRVILDGEVSADYTPVINKTIGLYKQCTSLVQRDSHGIQDLKEIVTKIQWPMINQGQLSPGYNWTKVFAQLNKEFGFNFILSNYVYLDAKNTEIYSLYVDAPSLGVGRAQLTKPDVPNNKRILEAYKTYIKNTVLQFGDNYTQLEEDIDKMVDFEKRLAAITTESSDRRNRTDLYGNKTTLSEFIDKYDGIPLLNIEEQVFEDISGANISGETPLIVYDRPYFESVGAELESSKTDPETIANYMAWRTVQSLGGFTTKAMRDIRFEFSKATTGVEEQRALWEECVDSVNSGLTFALGRLYVDQHFSEKAKQDMNQMIDQLNKAFTQLLEDQNDWMETQTKDRALKKLDEMLRAIGFPEFLKNDTLLEDYYENLNFNNDDSYLNSIVKNKLWSTQKSLKKLNTLNTDRTQLDWSTGPAIVNAFFSPNVNRITFPAGILQAPFYTLGLPISLNLGAIGVVIGHEITHSFDDSGSQYDEYGNLQNWWDDITKDRFEERVKCFKDQYSNYNDSEVGIPVNGNLTIGENIADNGGLRQAFRALEIYSGDKPLLPASMKTFTNEQLFFLSFANVWCTNIRNKALINQIETDPHSPGKYRVWGSVSNSESFAKAFNCKSEANMNPKSKCILW